MRSTTSATTLLAAFSLATSASASSVTPEPNKDNALLAYTAGASSAMPSPGITQKSPHFSSRAVFVYPVKAGTKGVGGTLSVLSPQTIKGITPEGNGKATTALEVYLSALKGIKDSSGSPQPKKLREQMFESLFASYPKQGGSHTQGFLDAVNKHQKEKGLPSITMEKLRALPNVLFYRDRTNEQRIADSALHVFGKLAPQSRSMLFGAKVQYVKNLVSAFEGTNKSKSQFIRDLSALGLTEADARVCSERVEDVLRTRRQGGHAHLESILVFACVPIGKFIQDKVTREDTPKGARIEIKASIDAEPLPTKPVTFDPPVGFSDALAMEPDVPELPNVTEPPQLEPPSAGPNGGVGGGTGWEMSLPVLPFILGGGGDHTPPVPEANPLATLTIGLAGLGLASRSRKK